MDARLAGAARQSDVAGGSPASRGQAADGVLGMSAPMPAAQSVQSVQTPDASGSGVRLGKVVLDCPDPLRLAGFYAELLGGAVDADSGPDWADLSGAGGMLSFQRVPDFEPPSWPDGVPQQMHLDLEVAEFAGPHERVLALGARALDPLTPPTPGDGRGYRVYADPAGHPFCLCLAGAG